MSSQIARDPDGRQTNIKFGQITFLEIPSESKRKDIVYVTALQDIEEGERKFENYESA